MLEFLVLVNNGTGSCPQKASYNVELLGGLAQDNHTAKGPETGAHSLSTTFTTSWNRQEQQINMKVTDFSPV